MAMRA
jgi:phospholipid-transporting ATPase